MTVKVIDDSKGPHSGWRYQRFAFEDKYYRLLTIDNADDRRSHLSQVQSWGSAIAGFILVFDDVISVDTAHQILTAQRRAFLDGRSEGISTARKTMREALGL